MTPDHAALLAEVERWRYFVDSGQHRIADNMSDDLVPALAAAVRDLEAETIEAHELLIHAMERIQQDGRLLAWKDAELRAAIAAVRTVDCALHRQAFRDRLERIIAGPPAEDTP